MSLANNWPALMPRFWEAASYRYPSQSSLDSPTIVIGAGLKSFAALALPDCPLD